MSQPGEPPRGRSRDHNPFPIVPFMLMLISLTSGTRFWKTLDSSERPLQVFLMLGIAIPTLTLVLRPSLPKATARKRRVLVTVTNRLFLSSAPSTRAMIARLASGEWRLGQKWAFHSLGALGLILFTSRIGMLWFTAFGLYLNVVDTALVQSLILAAGWRTAPELCTATLADAPDVVAFLDAVHSVFNASWTIAVPFPLAPMPPPASATGRAAVSLAAVNSLVKVVSYLAPIIVAAMTEAEKHRRREAEWRQQGARPAAPAARRPSVAVRAVLALDHMRQWHPFHCLWAEVVAACGLWAACYAAAYRMCSTIAN